jgi:transposase InsO family protein
VSDLCRLFGHSKQAYYKSSKEPYALTQQQEAEISEFARAERDIDPKIGCRKLWIMFNKGPLKVSRRLFEDVMSAYGMMLKKKRRSVRTTNSMHGMPVYPNLVYSVIPQHPCQVWVADITYIPLKNADGTMRFCYLSIVQDSYSRYILGYYVGLTLETVYSSIALTMALETCKKLNLNIDGLVHHSDRGVQYASAEYVKLLQSNNISISMTEDGNPKDNPQAERINSTVKNELLSGLEFTTIQQVQEALAIKIPYYNNNRPHMSLSYITPAEALLRKGTIAKKWQSYRDAAIEKLDQKKEG